MIQDLIKLENIGDGALQLNHIKIDSDYRNKWNIHCEDFILIAKDGKPIRDTLYRVGGMGGSISNKGDYFMLLKHVEAFYDKKILKMSSSKDAKHLESRWCILDKEGNEKVEFESYKSPYLVNNSCIYHSDRKYYNIETGELYCGGDSSVESDEFLFIENSYDKDKSKRGVMKINKKDGSYEIFPKK